MAAPIARQKLRSGCLDCLSLDVVGGDPEPVSLVLEMGHHPIGE